MNEESSDWDSMSDPAAQDQPSSLEESGNKDIQKSKNEIRRASYQIGGLGQQEPNSHRTSTGYQPPLDSPADIAQKQRIKEGIHNKSFDLSTDNRKPEKHGVPKQNEKKEYGTPITNKVCESKNM